MKKAEDEYRGEENREVGLKSEKRMETEKERGNLVMARDLSVGVCVNVTGNGEQSSGMFAFGSARPNRDSDYLETNNQRLIAQKFYFHILIILNISKSRRPFRGILLI